MRECYFRQLRCGGAAPELALLLELVQPAFIDAHSATRQSAAILVLLADPLFLDYQRSHSGL